MNLDDTLDLIILWVKGGSVCLIKASIVTGAPVPVLMASRRASRSLSFWEVDIACSCWARLGDLARLTPSLSCPDVLLDEDPDDGLLGLFSRRGRGLGERRRLSRPVL